jgi:hypothetical protein
MRCLQFMDFIKEIKGIKERKARGWGHALA